MRKMFAAFASKSHPTRFASSPAATPTAARTAPMKLTATVLSAEQKSKKLLKFIFELISNVIC